MIVLSNLNCQGSSGYGVFRESTAFYDHHKHEFENDHLQNNFLKIFRKFESLFINRITEKVADGTRRQFHYQQYKESDHGVCSSFPAKIPFPWVAHGNRPKTKVKALSPHQFWSLSLEISASTAVVKKRADSGWRPRWPSDFPWGDS